MNPRIQEFITGIETSSQPTPGTPTNPADILTLSYSDANLEKLRRRTGTTGSPYLAVAGTSIAHGLTSIEDYCQMILKSTTGAVDMSANPQIAAGTRIGQRLSLLFTSDTDTVYLEDGTGLKLKNGNRRCIADTLIDFEWDGTNWIEMNWNGVGDLG